LGELIATNYNNMTYEKFGDFVRNTWKGDNVPDMKLMIIMRNRGGKNLS